MWHASGFCSDATTAGVSKVWPVGHLWPLKWLFVAHKQQFKNDKKISFNFFILIRVKLLPT